MIKHIYILLGRITLYIFNKLMASKVNRDPVLIRLTRDYNGIIQVTNSDDSVNGYIVFKNGRMKYKTGKTDNPDSTVVYRSPKDFITFILKYADLDEAVVNARLTMFGNLNILFKYGFIANYINPFVKKIKIKKYI